MSVTGKIFFDSAPFIYLIENHPKYGQKVDSFIVDVTASASSFVTTVISLAEFAVIPERNSRQDLIADFDHLVSSMSFDLLSINREIAVISYRLRAKYPALKTVDSLQIAAAIHAGCDHFFTNDYKLKRIQEINVVIVDEL